MAGEAAAPAAMKLRAAAAAAHNLMFMIPLLVLAGCARAQIYHLLGSGAGTEKAPGERGTRGPSLLTGLAPGQHDQFRRAACKP